MELTRRHLDGGRHHSRRPDTYPAAGPVKRIDFVTVGAGFRVRHASVPPEQAASDHRPVMADLFFRP